MSEPVTLMLVDDDEDLLELLGMRLESYGFSVVSCKSAVDALARAEQSPPSLLITDLRMSEMSGMALFEKFRQRWPTLPVIILTAHGSIEEAVEATRDGAFSFLTKPVNKTKLLKEIQQALALTRGEKVAVETALITGSPVMKRLIEQARCFADSDVNVLISGESGTGKELFAQLIHEAGRRCGKPWIPVNCGAIPADMLESELFGHCKGAFTGALRDHPGLFAAADGGTLFLDEIGDMPLPLQVKLLRVLQEKKVRALGETQSREIDVRVVSASHCDLDKAVKDGKFREDLYYRLNVIHIDVPPLRKRIEDIPLLISHFLRKAAGRDGVSGRVFSPAAQQLLLSYRWPGNVRELVNVIERCVAVCPAAVIPAQVVQSALPEAGCKPMPLTEAKNLFEKDYVRQLLEACSGNVSSAAEIAGRNRSDFYKIVKRHGLEVNDFKST